MKSIKKAPRRSQHNRVNYITLYKKYGKNAVEAEEIRLEDKYPLAFGKANPLRRIKILDQVLSKKEDEWNGKDD